jgi:carboxypeptidase C (cathepsin A)
MKKYFPLIILLIAFSFQTKAQEKIFKDTVVTTQHSATIEGQNIDYAVHKGMQPVWNKKGKIVATVGYTYYERKGIKDKKSRPVSFSFNGGPGSASLWMELGYTSPKMVNMDDKGHALQPFGIKENPHSILDATDLVYVDPVNTGYSRVLDEDAKHDEFFGVKADVNYLAKWIQTFISRNNRWLSPKFLIGESYGTVRVSGLAKALQSASIGLFFNGVVLVAPTELGIERDGAIAEALRVPYYAATAWHYNKLPKDLQQQELTKILPEIEKFTMNKLIPAIAKGSSISQSEKQMVKKKLERYTSIEQLTWDRNNLSVPTSLFWKELLRDEGYTIGRLDSRYLGIDKKIAGSRPDFNAEIPAWARSFAPAANDYYKNDLNFKTDVPYLVLSGKVYPWERKPNNTGDQLRRAMQENPSLHVLIQSGYYDGSICHYFNAKYTMWQIGTSKNLQDRMTWKGYKCGHMIYMDKQARIDGNADIRDFIKNSVPAKGEPSNYSIEPKIAE